MTMKSTSNGKLLRRHGDNIGDEDDLICDLEDDEEEEEEDGTLLRKNNRFHQQEHQSSKLVNGHKRSTAEKQQQNYKGGAADSKDNSAFKVTKILEKGKASLSRSKSELGEQHRKMISHLSRGKCGITEQNKKLMANLGSGLEKSKKLIPGGFNNGSSKKGSHRSQYSDDTLRQASHYQDSSEDCVISIPNSHNGHMQGEEEQEIKEQLPSDLDGLMRNLGIDVMQITKKRTLDRTTTNGVRPAVNRVPSSYESYCQPAQQEDLNTYNRCSIISGQQQAKNNHFNQLEQDLENDYGEFEFIDEGGTLTRTLKTTGESVSNDHRRSMFSFSDEVFDELQKNGTLEHQQKQHKQKQEEQPVEINVHPKELYETYGAWRQRKVSASSSSIQQQGGTTSYVSQYQHHYNNNNSVSVTSSSSTNTSAKLSALIADQTLLLRHHKRRQQHQQRKWSSSSPTSHKLSTMTNSSQDIIQTDHHQLDDQREEQIQSLLVLQQQLAAATKEHLEGSSTTTNNSLITQVGAPLRRCSSLSQTSYLPEYDDTCSDFFFKTDKSKSTTNQNRQASKSIDQSEFLTEEPLPPQKITGSGPPLSPSPWLSTPTSSSTSYSNNGRYLYRGKFQPTPNNNPMSNSMNNNQNHQNNTKSPWLLRSNLSSFARRRRGSSTSLHTFSDNDDEVGAPIDLNINFSNINNKQKQADSISLADSAEAMSLNHR
jgi:hypothetical protein